MNCKFVSKVSALQNVTFRMDCTADFLRNLISMVEKFGMSRSVGLVSHGKGGGRGRSDL